MGGERGDRVFPPVPDQVLGEFYFFLRDGGVTLHQFRIHNGQVQSGLNAVVKEYGVEHFTAGRGQAERDVGDAQYGLALRQRLFDCADALDGFRRRTEVIFVPCAAGKNQGIENDILGFHAVFLSENLAGARRYLQLALSGNSLGLLLVLVDATDH